MIYFSFITIDSPLPPTYYYYCYYFLNYFFCHYYSKFQFIRTQARTTKHSSADSFKPPHKDNQFLPLPPTFTHLRL